MGKNRTNSYFSFAASSLVFVIGVMLLLLPSCGDPEALVNSIVGQVTVAAAPTYSLTMQEDSLANVTPKGTVTVKKDIAQSISAEPVAGYHFVQWTVVEGDGVLFDDDTSSVTTVTLTSEDATIRADCEPDIYTLTIQDDGNGSATPTGEIQVEHGAPRNISAEADPGWTFSTWYLVTGTGQSFDPANIASTTITLTQGDVTIEARFTQFSYTLTMDNDTNGYTTPAKGDTPVAHGADTPIAAYPNDGYHFLSWTEDPDLENAAIWDAGAFSTTVALTGPATVKANFEIDTYALTVTKVGVGDVTVGGIVNPVDSVDADFEDPIALIATPATGYDFDDGWSAEVNPENATFSNPGSETNASVSLEGDATIRANFNREEYELDVSSGIGGGTDISGPNTAYYGLPMTIVATPETENGYDFVEWDVTSGTGYTFDPDEFTASATITLESGAVAITAIFELREYQLTVVSDGNGSITQPATSPVWVSHEVSTPIAASPDPGYEFAGWTKTDGIDFATIAVPGDSATTVICTEAATIQANFSMIPANMAISQGGSPVTEGGPAYPFGTVIDDDSGNYCKSSEITFTIINDGGEASDFTVSSVSLTGAQAGNFNLTFPGLSSDTLLYDETLDFKLQFDPVIAGALAATVSIASNAPNDTLFEFDITGTGETFSIEMVTVNETQPAVDMEMGTGVVGTNPVVILSPYSIGVYEITYEEWVIVHTWATTRTTDSYTFYNSGNKGSKLDDSGSVQEPVTDINWKDAIAWCNAASELAGLQVAYYEDTSQSTVYRDATSTTVEITDTSSSTDPNACVNWGASGYKLPTEAQWEYAARYENGTDWTLGTWASGAAGQFGPETQAVAWYSENSVATHVVGEKTGGANALGLYDMSGNVWEFCWNIYESSYTAGTFTDPRGPADSTSAARVKRGGSWGTSATYVRTGNRTGISTDHVSNSTQYGLRVVR